MTTWQLPLDVRSAGVARRNVRTLLGGWGAGGRADDALLLTSELVSNAVLHGRSRVTVVAELNDGVLRVEVTDDEPELPVQRVPSASSFGGRGVALVDALADRWGVESHPGDGKTVYIVLRD